MSVALPQPTFVAMEFAKTHPVISTASAMKDLGLNLLCKLAWILMNVKKLLVRQYKYQKMI